MGFLDAIAQKMAERRQERRAPHATPVQPPPGGMMIVAPPTPGTMGSPGVVQVVPPGMPEAPQVPMGRPSYAVFSVPRPPVAESPGFWDRIIAAHQAGYLAKKR